jgi:N-acetylglucosamine-6-sulfatase
VKKLVKTLKATGQLQNTVIMFLSDNGWLQGEHRIPGDKFLPYEESIRIPLIIRGPGIKRDAIVNGQVGNIDFAPTLLDAANARSGRVMDGVSLMPTARRPKNRPDRALHLEAPAPLFAGPIPVNTRDRPYKGVRTDRYTYVFWTETAEEELYDLQLDPNQLTNLARNPVYESVKADLAAKLALLEKCAGASCQVKP